MSQQKKPSDNEDPDSTPVQSLRVENSTLFDPALIAGTKAVPAVRYAVGVVGVCAAAAIATSFFNKSLETTAVATVVLLGLMFLLWVFSRLVALAKDDLRTAMLGLTWAFLVLTVASVALVLSSTFFRYPRPLPDIVDDLLHKTVAIPNYGPEPYRHEDKPITDPTSVESKTTQLNTRPQLPTRERETSPHESKDIGTVKGKIPENQPQPVGQALDAGVSVNRPVAPAAPQQSLTNLCPKPQSDPRSLYSAIPDEPTSTFLSTNYGNAAKDAYRNHDYDWSCYYVLRERRFGILDFWRWDQAYLAGALYMLGKKPEGLEQLHNLIAYATDGSPRSKNNLWLDNYARAIDTAGATLNTPARDEFKRGSTAIRDYKDGLSN